MESVILQKS
jgi:hypothetical protein